MSDARRQDQWNHTAQVLAMLFNTHRDPKTRLMQPAEFHPFGRRETEPPKTKDLSLLRAVFVKE